MKNHQLHLSFRHLYLIVLLATTLLACEGGEEVDTTAGTEVNAGMMNGVAGQELEAGENTAGENTAGENTAGENTAGENTAGETTAGENTAGENTAGENTAGENTAGENTAGENTAGENTAGENTAGENTAGENTAGDTAGTEEAGEDVIIETPDEGGEEWMDPEDFGAEGQGAHAFTMLDIDGEEVDMRRYRGRVILAINVASRCGYTSQYEDLQRLYSEYREQGLVILGFPANNFGSQEPGTDEEIAEFCTANYGVTFPMFSKISVKGADIHPLFSYLTEESGQEVSWNFNKFVVGRDGMFIDHFLSNTTPYSDTLIQALESALATE